MGKILITGSNGFVGKVLCHELEKRKINYLAGVRTAKSSREISYGDFTNQKNWENLLIGINTVVHLAARVHVMEEEASNPLNAFMQTNCEATVVLASAAKKLGVRRFIFLSSIKVNGEETFGTAYRATDISNPQDPYGVSKMEAEKRLLALHERGVFEVVIIRPPLVYGQGVKANFKNLMKLVECNLPLPFGMADSNKRSMVSVLNLVDLIILCIDHPNAGGNIFLVSDDNDLSLKELILKISLVKKKRVFLFPIPLVLMKMIITCIGKKDYASRLFGDLQIDIDETKKLLSWEPRHTFEDTFKF